MNKTVGLHLVVYGFLLAGLSYLAHHLARGEVVPTLITGLVGGGLSLVWGVWAMAGCQRKALPILTLIPVSYVLLTQTFASWSGASAAAATVVTLLLVLSVAVLVRIAWSGVVFDVQPKTSPANDGNERMSTATRVAPGRR